MRQHGTLSHALQQQPANNRLINDLLCFFRWPDRPVYYTRQDAALLLLLLLLLLITGIPISGNKEK